MTRAVQFTREFARIMQLPTRQWEPQAAGLVGPLTNLLRVPGGMQELRPVQAVALAELHDHGGMFLQGRVGCGKTLTAALATAILDYTGTPAHRPILFIPAHMRDDTIKAMRLSCAHWRIRVPKINSYNELGTAAQKALLDVYQPDLIILDEAHYVRNMGAARTARMHRYICERRAKGLPLRVAVMSGTTIKRELKDIAQLLWWALPHLYPLPNDSEDLRDWGLAVDGKVNEGERVEPGALLRLCDPADQDPDLVARARRGLSRRIFGTPGIIATRDVGTGIHLRVEGVEVAPAPELEEHFQNLRAGWTLPDGWTLIEAAVRWKHLKQLALGFYYRWDPRPPQDWLDARKAWAVIVRHMLSHKMLECDIGQGKRAHLDTEHEIELDVLKAKEHGVLHLAEAQYDAWAAIRDTFKPNSVPEWLSDHALRFAADWALSNNGVVWTEFGAFGRALSRMTGLPYYGPQGRNAAGGHISEDPGGRSIIASIKANATGRNLQDRWCKMLVTSADPTGELWEQMIGRLDREGQKSPSVLVQVMIGGTEQLQGLLGARDDAFTVQPLSGPQKLCYCDFQLPMLRHGSSMAFGT